MYKQKPRFHNYGHSRLNENETLIGGCNAQEAPVLRLKVSMENIYFEYEGKRYSGYLLDNPAGESDYAWFVFNEDEMSALFGDTIAFLIRKGELLPVYHYTHRAPFVEYLRKKVEAAYLLREKERL